MIGMKIVSSPLLVESYEDWSKVRSPGRAARRRKQGHPQNITAGTRPGKTCVIGNTIYAHPTLVQKLQNEINARTPKTKDDVRLGFGFWGMEF